MNSSKQINGADLYRPLSRWFKKNARPLPWRGETRPYRIWISEIMLVQTTGAVITKRYPRFIRRFPSLKSLANASLDDVLKEWEGLGYYHRARFLHQAACIIRDQYAGRFPRHYDQVRALPGVGDYVAAAVTNFSFGTRIPAVDANIARLGARLFGIPGDVRSSKVRREIHRQLTSVMDVGEGAVWTDGMIELGAVICTPRKPRCEECPLQSHCQALTRGRQGLLGLPQKRPPRSEVAVACGIIRRADGRILIAQRLEQGLLPGLWEFPGGKRQGRESLADTCRREIQEELAIEVEVGQKRIVIRHAYSHYHVRLHVFDCEYSSGKPKALGCQRSRWVRPGELTRFAFPAANQAIIKDIQQLVGRM